MAGHLYEVAIRISENPNMLEGGSYGSSIGPGIIGLFDEYYYKYRRETQSRLADTNISF